MIVVLPEPLLPSKPKVSPRMTSKDRSSMTRVLLNCIEKFLIEMIESIPIIIRVIDYKAKGRSGECAHATSSVVNSTMHAIGVDSYNVKNTCKKCLNTAYIAVIFICRHYICSSSQENRHDSNEDSSTRDATLVAYFLLVFSGGRRCVGGRY